MGSKNRSRRWTIIRGYDVSGTRSTHIDYLVDKLVAGNAAFGIATRWPEDGTAKPNQKIF